jgi:predicted outer membrane repeat protein
VAASGDVVLVKQGTYSGSGNRNLSFAGKAITVTTSPFYLEPEDVIIDCGGSPNRAFEFVSGETTSSIPSKFTVRNGDVRTRVVNFIDDKSGGALKIQSSPTVSNCIFEDCQARSGGAIAVYRTGDPVLHPVIEDCIFRRNQATVTSIDGGAIMCGGNGAPIIAECTFDSNVAGRDGGAISTSALPGSDSVTVENCLFLRNKARTDATGYGGAIRALGRTVVRGCTFYDNKSADGSALSAYGCPVVFARNLVAFSPSSGLHTGTGSTLTFQCNDFFENTGGSIVGIYDSTDVDANTIFEDPLLCDTASNDFQISSYSPCDEDSSKCGLLIGRYNNACTRCCNFAGDVDNSGDGPDITDLTYLIDFLYMDGPWPPCPDEADMNGEPGIDISDLSYLIAFLYVDGPAPTCP